MKKDEQLLGIGHALAELLLFRLRATPISGQRWYRHAMLFFFSKAFKTFEAVGFLWSKGFVEDSCVLARSVYELRLQAIYLSQAPEERSKLFIRQWFKAGYGTYLLLNAEGDPERESELALGLKAMREGVDAAGFSDIFDDDIAARKAIAQKWWGGTIRKLVKDVGLGVEYDLIYSQLSDFAHSGLRVMHRFVQQRTAGELQMLYRPERNQNLLIPWSATDWLIQIIGFTGRAFELEFDSQVYFAQLMAKSVLDNSSN
jgi:uncharacterized protein DUF5677